jgi:LysR family nitrogen assimilation transcriptional regulator
VLQDPPTLDELDAEPVVSERLGLVSDARASGPDGTGALRVRQLAGLRLILPERRHWIRRLVDNAAHRRGIALDGVQQADSVPLIKEMVRNGHGHTVLPLAAVRDEVARGALSFRSIDHDPLLTVHAVACRRGDNPTPITLSPFVTGVRRMLRDVMSGLAASGDWAGANRTGTPAKSAEPVIECVLEAAIE